MITLEFQDQYLTTHELWVQCLVEELFVDPSFRLAYYSGELDEAIKYCAERSVILEERKRDSDYLV